MLLERIEDGSFVTAQGKWPLRTHQENADCYKYGCPIHSPSPHIQNREDWPFLWREDRGIMERICKHGIGHPDLDAADRFERLGQDWQNVHGCDGCCTGISYSLVERIKSKGRHV